ARYDRGRRPPRRSPQPMPETPQTDHDDAPARRPDPLVQWNKCQNYLDKLFDSLEGLEEGGGLAQVMRSAGWSAKAQKRALASLTAVRTALDAPIRALKGSGK